VIGYTAALLVLCSLPLSGRGWNHNGCGHYRSHNDYVLDVLSKKKEE
jgi:hypothetical protein